MASDGCLNFDANMDRCPCTAEKCERKGVCCECMARHLEKGGLPACARAAVKEAEAL